jgi:hypothetical protein
MSESIMKAQLLAVVVLAVVAAHSAEATSQLLNTSDPFGRVQEVRGLAYLCHGICPDNKQLATVNDEIYPGSLIETDPGAVIRFYTYDVSSCVTRENSKLQIRPNDKQAIEWLDIEPPAFPVGLSWCIKQEGAKEQEYSVAGIRFLATGTTFGVVHNTGIGSVIKIYEGSATVTVGPVRQIKVEANEELVVPRVRGSDGAKKRTLVLSAEDKASIDRLNTPTAFAVNSTAEAGGEVTIMLRGEDVETCDLIFSPISGPTSGELSPIRDQPCTLGSPNSDTAELTYTHNGSDSTNDSFTYQVCEDATSCATATVSITITPTPTPEPETPTPTPEPETPTPTPEPETPAPEEVT